VPLFTVDPTNRLPAWQQVADTIRNAIGSGMLAAGDPLPSVREMSALQDVPVTTPQHAMAVLANEDLIAVRQGRTAVVAGDAAPDRRSGPAAHALTAPIARAIALMALTALGLPGKPFHDKSMLTPHADRSLG
jgi:GntR family transcriptional regulator